MWRNCVKMIMVKKSRLGKKKKSPKTEVTLGCLSKLSSHHHFWPCATKPVPNYCHFSIYSAWSRHPHAKGNMPTTASYRVIQFERDCWRSLNPIPLLKPGQSRVGYPAQALQHLVWLNFEYLQSCKFQNVSGSLLQCLTTSRVKKILLNIWPEIHVFQPKSYS